MPEDPYLADGGFPPSESRRGRTRRHRRRPVLLRYWWLVPTVLGVVSLLFLWNVVSPRLYRSDPLPGYILDSARLEQEYQQLTGKPLQDAAVLRQFEQATKFMLAGNYANSAIVMETVSKAVPVPAAFNDLALLYLKINDGPRAVNAFRDALARDHDYQPVRANIKSLQLNAAMEPGTSELEPNDSKVDANAIWLDKPLDGYIGPNRGDIDCYWFITSKPPRDRISILVANHSTNLNPRLRVFSSDGKLLSGLKEATGPGASLRFDFSPPPNSFYNIQVDGAGSTTGDYTLTVSSLHAYDLYEPNDDILSATRITLGQSIPANIMDAADTDYYAFTSPIDSSITVNVTPLDASLLAGLGTFAPDLRTLGFGPDAEKPGAPLHYVMKVEANQIYYLQVFGKTDTTGAYSIQVK